MKKHKTVDEFIENEKRWKDELKILRNIINETELIETLKWGTPVYTFDGKNVVGIGSFKTYFGMWFFQGVFLKDKAKKLINAQEDKTKALRQWRFGSKDGIDKKLILQYLDEAIESQKAGKEIKPVRNKPLEIPDELKKKFKESPEVKKAFEKFSLSKQREFTEYISEAKREDTKHKRIEKIVPMILDNIGLNDRYKNK